MIVVTRTSSINYYGTKYLTEAILSNKLLNGKKGRIVFVSSLAGSSAFGKANKQTRTEFANIVANGSKQDLDALMQTFANAVKSNNNNVVSGNLKFGRSAYGMSKVCKINMYNI